SPPLPVAALAAAQTVRLAFDGLAVPDADVVARLPYRQWAVLNRARMIDAHPAVFGVTAAAVRLPVPAGRHDPDAAPLAPPRPAPPRPARAPLLRPPRPRPRRRPRGAAPRRPRRRLRAAARPHHRRRDRRRRALPHPGRARPATGPGRAVPAHLHPD